MTGFNVSLPAKAITCLRFKRFSSNERVIVLADKYFIGLKGNHFTCEANELEKCWKNAIKLKRN